MANDDESCDTVFHMNTIISDTSIHYLRPIIPNPTLDLFALCANHSALIILLYSVPLVSFFSLCAGYHKECWPAYSVYQHMQINVAIYRLWSIGLINTIHMHCFAWYMGISCDACKTSCTLTTGGQGPVSDKGQVMTILCTVIILLLSNF